MSLAAWMPSSLRFFSICLLLARCCLSSADMAHPMMLLAHGILAAVVSQGQKGQKGKGCWSCCFCWCWRPCCYPREGCRIASGGSCRGLSLGVLPARRLCRAFVFVMRGGFGGTVFETFSDQMVHIGVGDLTQIERTRQTNKSLGDLDRLLPDVVALGLLLSH